MTLRIKTWRAWAPVALAILGVGLAGPALAQLSEAQSTATQMIADNAASQKRINQIDDQTSELLRDYRVVLRQLTDLRAYNKRKRELVQAQETEIANLRTQIDNVQTVSRDIDPLMERMLDGLKQFIALDVPFLLSERNDRVARLERSLASPNFKVAEKFRGVLEAYQIENTYGRTIETYSGRIGEGEEARTVDFLKIGRVAFYYQTKDEDQTALWDQANRQWVRLPDSYASQVRTGINMAKEIIPPNLMVLPVTAPGQSQ